MPSRLPVSPCIVKENHPKSDIAELQRQSAKILITISTSSAGNTPHSTLYCTTLCRTMACLSSVQNSRIDSGRQRLSSKCNNLGGRNMHTLRMFCILHFVKSSSEPNSGYRSLGHRPLRRTLSQRGVLICQGSRSSQLRY